MTRPVESVPPPHVAIVLAAGRSRRLGQPKQLLVVDGETLLRRAVRFAIASGAAETFVVLGADAESLRESLKGLACRERVCTRDDMASSLRTGLHAVSAPCAAALVVLTDQPALDAAHLQALVARWRCDPQRAVASAYADVIGVPAVLPRAWFAPLLAAEGDHGARELLRTNADSVYRVEAAQLAFDIDAAHDLQRWRDSGGSA